MNAPQRPRSAWRDRLLLAVLLAVSFAFSAAVAEVALRLLGHHGAPQMLIDNAVLVEGDPILDWRYAPGSSWQEGRVVYQINASGFRDVEHEVAKPPGTRRIVVVGDSVTEGTGVEWEDTFAGVLQSRLRGEYEVVNLAQSGLNTPQEIHLLERDGLAYQPDVVVINFVLNDCDFYTRLAPARQYYEERGSQIDLLFNMPIDPRLKRTLKSSALLYFLKERGEELKGRIVGTGEGDYFEKLWSSDANRAKVTEGFDRLAELQAQHGFAVLILVWPLVIEFDGYRYASIHDWVREAALQRGFAVRDLLRDFASMPFRELQVTGEDYIHPNRHGHGMAADVFVDWLRSAPAAGG